MDDLRSALAETVKVVQSFEGTEPGEKVLLLLEQVPCLVQEAMEVLNTAYPRPGLIEERTRDVRMFLKRLNIRRQALDPPMQHMNNHMWPAEPRALHEPSGAQDRCYTPQVTNQRHPSYESGFGAIPAHGSTSTTEGYEAASYPSAVEVLRLGRAEEPYINDDSATEEVPQRPKPGVPADSALRSDNSRRGVAPQNARQNPTWGWDLDDRREQDADSDGEDSGCGVSALFQKRERPYVDDAFSESDGVTPREADWSQRTPLEYGGAENSWSSRTPPPKYDGAENSWSSRTPPPKHDGAENSWSSRTPPLKQEDVPTNWGHCTPREQGSAENCWSHRTPPWPDRFSVAARDGTDKNVGQDHSANAPHPGTGRTADPSWHQSASSTAPVRGPKAAPVAMAPWEWADRAQERYVDNALEGYWDEEKDTPHAPASKPNVQKDDYVEKNEATSAQALMEPQAHNAGGDVTPHSLAGYWDTAPSPAWGRQPKYEASRGDATPHSLGGYWETAPSPARANTMGEHATSDEPTPPPWVTSDDARGGEGTPPHSRGNMDAKDGKNPGCSDGVGRSDSRSPEHPASSDVDVGTAALWNLNGMSDWKAEGQAWDNAEDAYIPPHTGKKGGWRKAKQEKTRKKKKPVVSPTQKQVEVPEKIKVRLVDSEDDIEAPASDDVHVNVDVPVVSPMRVEEQFILEDSTREGTTQTTSTTERSSVTMAELERSKAQDEAAMEEFLEDRPESPIITPFSLSRRIVPAPATTSGQLHSRLKRESTPKSSSPCVLQDVTRAKSEMREAANPMSPIAKKDKERDSVPKVNSPCMPKDARQRGAGDRPERDIRSKGYNPCVLDMKPRDEEDLRERDFVAPRSPVRQVSLRNNAVAKSDDDRPRRHPVGPSGLQTSDATVRGSGKLQESGGDSLVAPSNGKDAVNSESGRTTGVNGAQNCHQPAVVSDLQDVADRVSVVLSGTTIARGGKMEDTATATATARNEVVDDLFHRWDDVCSQPPPQTELPYYPPQVQPNPIAEEVSLPVRSQEGGDFFVEELFHRVPEAAPLKRGVPEKPLPPRPLDYPQVSPVASAVSAGPVRSGDMGGPDNMNQRNERAYSDRRDGSPSPEYAPAPCEQSHGWAMRQNPCRMGSLPLDGSSAPTMHCGPWEPRQDNSAVFHLDATVSGAAAAQGGRDGANTNVLGARDGDYAAHRNTASRACEGLVTSERPCNLVRDSYAHESGSAENEAGAGFGRNSGKERERNAPPRQCLADGTEKRHGESSEQDHLHSSEGAKYHSERAMCTPKRMEDVQNDNNKPPVAFFASGRSGFYPQEKDLYSCRSFDQVIGKGSPRERVHAFHAGTPSTAYASAKSFGVSSHGRSLSCASEFDTSVSHPWTQRTKLGENDSTEQEHELGCEDFHSSARACVGHACVPRLPRTSSLTDSRAYQELADLVRDVPSIRSFLMWYVPPIVLLAILIPLSLLKLVPFCVPFMCAFLLQLARQGREQYRWHRMVDLCALRDVTRQGSDKWGQCVKQMLDTVERGGLAMRGQMCINWIGVASGCFTTMVLACVGELTSGETIVACVAGIGLILAFPQQSIKPKHVDERLEVLEAALNSLMDASGPGHPEGSIREFSECCEENKQIRWLCCRLMMTPEPLRGERTVRRAILYLDGEVRLRLPLESTTLYLSPFSVQVHTPVKPPKCSIDAWLPLLIQTSRWLFPLDAVRKQNIQCAHAGSLPLRLLLSRGAAANHRRYLWSAKPRFETVSEMALGFDCAGDERVAIQYLSDFKRFSK